MLLVSIILVLLLLALLFIVDFVLANLAMFQTPFDIVIRVPFTSWENKWEGIPFMYIIVGSVLLGALVISLSTWVLDARRKLKIRSQRKELKRLKAELQEVHAALPQEELEASSEETVEEQEESSATPSQITKSFEDAVEGGDFLENFQQKDDAEESESSEEAKRSQDAYVEPEEEREPQEELPLGGEESTSSAIEVDVGEPGSDSLEQDDAGRDEEGLKEAERSEDTNVEPEEKRDSQEELPVEDEKNQFPQEVPTEVEVVEPADSSEQDDTTRDEKELDEGERSETVSVESEEKRKPQEDPPLVEDEKKKLPQETPVEAEVVEAESNSSEQKE